MPSGTWRSLHKRQDLSALPDLEQAFQFRRRLLVAVLVETLLFGVHLVLFLACLYFLVTRKMRMLLSIIAGTVIMFGLAIADIAMSFRLVLQGTPLTPIVSPNSPTPNLDLITKILPKIFIFATCNLIAGLLLIARFYVVWGEKKYLLILTIAPLLAATALTYAITPTNPKRLIIFAATNFSFTVFLNGVLTVLTASRIWCIQKRQQHGTHRDQGRQFRMTSMITIESGALYTLSLIISAALARTPFMLIGGTVMFRMVSISPLLMTVQIALSGRKPPPQSTTTQGRNSVVLDTVILTSSGGATPSDADDIELQERLDGYEKRGIH